jgi:hypothetical protein
VAVAAAGLSAAAQLRQGGAVHAGPGDSARAERATDVKLRGVREESPARLARPARRPGLRRIDAKRIGDALEDYGNADLHYDDWIRIGHALKRDLPGADGLELWCWWSSLSKKDTPDLTRRKWATFDPREITAGTIFYLAGGGR